MRMRLGLGPVFAYEWLTTSRRWQVYAARSLFVAILLVGLVIAWTTNDTSRSRATIQGQAEVGLYLYQAIVGTQLVLLLLAAPAATAGAVCLDKARGTLTHLLMTDLSNAEIVLGKLAARLAPVLGLAASALPAVALGTLMGGIDPRALTGAFLVSLGVAVFACTLALVLSIWGTKTHEVLMMTYAILLVFLLAGPVLSLSQWGMGRGPGAPDWLYWANPFWLVFANSSQPGTVDLMHDLIFLAAALVGSAGLLVAAIVRVRAVAARHAGQGSRRQRIRWWSGKQNPGRARREWRTTWLDRNPVLWREWHRRRPSRWSWILWGFYAVAAVFVSGHTIYVTLWGDHFERVVSTFFFSGQVAVGFLLLSVVSATSLSEERVRGSLDVLLATPIATRSIVFGKWWGTYRGVVRFSLLPGLVIGLIAWRGGQWLGGLLVFGLILSFGAAQTSLGLALATWIPRPGRVMALNVSAYLLVTLGWIFVVLPLAPGGSTTGPGLASASPLVGVLFPLELMQEDHPLRLQHDWLECLVWIGIWNVVYATLAIGLLVSTLATFDRCLGRVPNTSEASSPRPSSKPIANQPVAFE